MFITRKKDKLIQQNLEEELPKRSRKEKKEEDELVWDRKRVVIAFILILVLLFGARQAKGMFFPDTNILGESTVKKASEIDKPKVEGIKVDLESDVTSKFVNIKNSIIDLNPEEIASSSPQIQKVLKDIKEMKNLPVDQARNTCMKICSGI